jgi:hypothetical protein
MAGASFFSGMSVMAHSVVRSKLALFFLPRIYSSQRAILGALNLLPKSPPKNLTRIVETFLSADKLALFLRKNQLCPQSLSAGKKGTAFLPILALIGMMLRLVFRL